jgi:hypothetical protein
MTDPLPSWRDGATKSAIVDFVAAVATPGHPEHLPPGERIAVFDNDGTLWCEQPAQAQVLFAMDRAREMAAADPALKDREPFKAFLSDAPAAIHALGKEGAFQFAFAIHAGMSIEAFNDQAQAWLVRARHPTLDRPYTDTAYRPQLELLGFLRRNGFTAFIVSGGGIDFMRAFALGLYGVPPHRVIGSSVKTQLVIDDNSARLMKLAELQSFDDREEKVRNIGLHIGCRPILAFGNSDGDLAMLRYTLAGPGRRLALLLHHDDAEREMAYDRAFRLSPLAEALDRANELGLRVVSMRRDWSAVFA